LIVDDEIRSMKDFLIMPVQHIPRLQLLLRGLLKSTWRSHPDYENLEKASNTLSQTVAYIENASVRNANVNQVREIAGSLMGRRVAQLQLVAPHRVLVKEASECLCFSGTLFVVLERGLLFSSCIGCVCTPIGF
jgi:RhoGEF domain